MCWHSAGPKRHGTGRCGSRGRPPCGKWQTCAGRLWQKLDDAHARELQRYQCPSALREALLSSTNPLLVLRSRLRAKRQTLAPKRGVPALTLVHKHKAYIQLADHLMQLSASLPHSAIAGLP